jgi:hypothetical protein
MTAQSGHGVPQPAKYSMVKVRHREAQSGKASLPPSVRHEFF